MKFTPLKAGLTASVGALCLLLTACGSGDSGSASDGGLPKTIVVSVPSLQVDAMKAVATGVEDHVKSDGWKVVTQDGGMDGQKQAEQLSTVVSAGTVGALWVIAISPSSLKQVLTQAQDKGIPVYTNGAPKDYGFDGLQPGITFSTIDYAKYGEAVGKELGACIDEKLGGDAEVIWGKPVAGASGKEEMEKAEQAALLAEAPKAKIVSEVASGTLQAAQTDVGNALQGNPGANAVLASVDEVALGAVAAFASAGKDLPCAVSAGGGPQAQDAVKAGKMYATVALQFQEDITQGFKAIEAMRADTKKTGAQLYLPQLVVKAGK